jgi:hypothetical protein
LDKERLLNLITVTKGGDGQKGGDDRSSGATEGIFGGILKFNFRVFLSRNSLAIIFS